MPRALALVVLALGVAAIAWWALSGEDNATGSSSPDATHEPAPTRTPELIGSAGPKPARPPDAEEMARAEASKRDFSGTVLDPDGHPVAGARISIWDRARLVAEVRTDARGRFVYRGHEGELWVRFRARAPGLVESGGEEWLRRGDPLSIHLIKGLPVRVTVTDVDGAAVVGAKVVSVCGDAISMRPDWESRQSDRARSDDHGKATVYAAPGMVAVFVAKPGFAVKASAAEHVAETGLDVEIVLQRGGVVEGTVIDPDGKPVEKATVRARGYNLYDERIETDAAGRFRFEDMPHTHAKVGLSVRPQAQWVPRAWRIDAPEPGKTVTTRVRVQGGLFVSGVVLGIDDALLPGVQIGFVPRDADWWRVVGSRKPVASAVSGEHGGFRLGPVPRGRGLVWAWIRNGPKFEDIEFEIEDDDVVLKIRPKPVGERTATVRVLDAEGEPVFEASVGASRQDGGDLSVWSETDESGVAILRGLPAAPVLVETEIEGVCRQNVNADLTHGDASDVVVRIPGATMTGRITLPDGKPAANVEIDLMRLQDNGEEDYDAYRDTDAQGRITFRGLRAGVTYGISPSNDAHAILEGPLRFKAGARDLHWIVGSESEAQRRLPRLALRTPDGEPIVDAWVRADRRDEDADCFEELDDGTYVAPHRLPATVTLYIFVEGHRPAVLSEVRLRPGPEPRPVTVELDRGASVEGRVVSAAGEPVRRVRVYAGKEGEEQSIWSEDGAFDIQGLEPGPVDLLVDGVFIVGREVTATAGIHPDPITIRVEPAGAISVLVDQQPPSFRRSYVHVRREGSEESRASTFSIDPDSQRTWCMVGSLEPGRYAVTVHWGGKDVPAGEVDVRASASVEVVFDPPAPPGRK